MTGKIKYKPISKELENMAKPTINSSSRASIGLDKAVGEYYYIGIDQLYPFQNQARKIFNQDDISKLADSIREHGVRQPLSVIKIVSGKYEVVSGERRLRAAKEAGLDKVPCIILKETNDADSIALIENIHRKDLHPIELGGAYKKLIENKVFVNQEKLAQAISIAKSTVSECIKLSNIPENIKICAIKNNISSRDKLRKLLKAYEDNDLKKMESLVGLTGRQYKNFSVIRILSSEGKIKIQDSGIARLSIEDRKVVRDRLKKLAEKIESY